MLIWHSWSSNVVRHLSQSWAVCSCFVRFSLLGLSRNAMLAWYMLSSCVHLSVHHNKTQFIHSFVPCGQGSSLLWTPALSPYPVHLPRERKGTGRCVRCGKRRAGKAGYIAESSLLGISIARPFQTWPTAWLSPDWLCILRQPAASQVYLLRLTPVLQADLTLQDQGTCNDHSLQRTPSNPLFPARDYLPVHHVHRNYQK